MFSIITSFFAFGLGVGANKMDFVSLIVSMIGYFMISSVRWRRYLSLKAALDTFREDGARKEKEKNVLYQGIFNQSCGVKCL